MGVKFGKDAKLYYKVGGISGGGSWLEITNARDVDVDLEVNESDVTTRGNNGFEATAPTLKKLTIDFDMVDDSSNPAFVAIRTAFLAGSAIGIRSLNSTNGEGPQADMSVFKFTRSEKLKDAIIIAITLKPTYSADAPTWVEAS